MRDGLQRYVALCLRLGGRPARRAASRNAKLGHALEQAHLPFLPEDFVALTWVNTALLLGAGYGLVAVGLLVVNAAGVGVTPPAVAVLLLLPLLLSASAYVAQSVFPDYRAGERRRLIDRDLPYAVNYIAAMSSAGIVPTVLLRDLARETTYGEVAREVAWMVRDIDLLGFDLLTTINRAIARSPSARFQEFLQGAKTTILSGGDLKSYFAGKAEQYMMENRRTQREFLDGLGILSESYVTVVIAGPLFMIVLLSIMLLLGRGALATMSFLFLLVFLALPLSHTAFAWVIRNMSPEA
jgi:flagellar protein FlaJ